MAHPSASDTPMHEDQLPIDDALAARLVATQFPRWAHLPLVRQPPESTVNTIYRLGEEFALRLPMRPGQEAQFEKDLRWLPVLRPHLPLAIPEPLEVGQATEDYPSGWAVYRWLPGAPATSAAVRDPVEAAEALAAFVLALQRVDPSGGPGPGPQNYGRGAPLASRDESARRGIEALRGEIDADAATATWEAALTASGWEGLPTWLHGDLMPGNLLILEGQLSAVIDFGALGVGDPAADMMAAWTFLPTEARRRYRDALGVDDAMWTRGRGWALWVGLVGLPYYRETNPAFADVVRRTIHAVLSDDDR